MIRMSMILLTLILVSVIGLTFGPFESLAYQFYNLFSYVGMNPSFTPVTFDMSMMTSIKGDNNFRLPLQLVVQDKEGMQAIVGPADMDLYLIKIPLILFMEQASEGVDLKEARYAICHQLQKLQNRELQYFKVTQKEGTTEFPLMAKEFSCEITRAQ